MREAGLEEGLKELKDIQRELPKALEIDELILPGDGEPDANEDKAGEQPDLTAWIAPQAVEAGSPTSDEEAPGSEVQSAEIQSEPVQDQPLQMPEE
jgi:hypothetical protein